jgi:hypothetical protein
MQYLSVIEVGGDDHMIRGCGRMHARAFPEHGELI